MQSDALPDADSSRPTESTTATLPAANPGPFSGRTPKSAISPTTSDSGTVVSAPRSPLPRVTAAATRTSRTRNGCALDGTDHVS